MALLLDGARDLFSTGGSIAVVQESLDDLEIVHIFGDADVATAPELERGLTMAVRLGKPLLADLSECRFIDAAGIGVLFRARKALATNFSVRIEPESFVARVLRLVEFDGIDDGVDAMAAIL